MGKNPLGKGFEPAKWVIKEAFDNVMASVSVASKVKATLFPAYCKALQAGNPREEHAVVYDHLRNTGWEWELFRNWERRFDADGAWPPLLLDYQKRRESPAEAEYQLAKVLAQFTSAKAHGLIRFYQGENAAKDSAGLYKYTWKAATDVAFKISEELAGQFNSGQLQDLPPFFPGDTCRLRHERFR